MICFLREDNRYCVCIVKDNDLYHYKCLEHSVVSVDWLKKIKNTYNIHFFGKIEWKNPIRIYPMNIGDSEIDTKTNILYCLYPMEFFTAITIDENKFIRLRDEFTQ